MIGVIVKFLRKLGALFTYIYIVFICMFFTQLRYCHVLLGRLARCWKKKGPVALPQGPKRIQALLEDEHYVRYAMYNDIVAFLEHETRARGLAAPRIIEFGGSNNFLKDALQCPSYEIARNYPEVDVQDLQGVASDEYDFVVLDQILEHVRNPDLAIKEMHRILKKGGWLIVTTPFLVQVHPDPGDYWRFTRDGINELLAGFSERSVKSWGNKQAAVFHLLIGTWISVRTMRMLGLFNLRNDAKYPYLVWGYARK